MNGHTVTARDNDRVDWEWCCTCGQHADGFMGLTSCEDAADQHRAEAGAAS